MKLLVLDIDDTIVKTNADMIGVWKRYPNGTEKRLSTSEFAEDPDSVDGGKSANVIFDYREFGDEEKVTNSINQGTPLIKNLRILDRCVKDGYEVAFLTARSDEDMVYRVLSNYLKTKVGRDYLPVKLNRKYCFAINDPKYAGKLGSTDAEKKARVLKYLCKEAEVVKFVDDDLKNIRNAKSLHLPNLKVITAWKESIGMKPVNNYRENTKMKKDLMEGATEEYLVDLKDRLESEYDLIAYFDKNGHRLNIETDVGDFDVEYAAGEWIYVIHFSGVNREFTETLEHTADAADLIASTLQDEANAVTGQEEDYEDYDEDYGNEDHSMDFDDEDSPYFMGGGKGW